MPNKKKPKSAGKTKAQLVATRKRKAQKKIEDTYKAHKKKNWA
mgnify:CR=1 FL=1